MSDKRRIPVNTKNGQLINMTQEIVFSRLLKREMTHSDVTVLLIFAMCDLINGIKFHQRVYSGNVINLPPFPERKYGSYQADSS